MRKHIAFALMLVMLLSLLPGCGERTTEAVANQDLIQAEASGMELHRIGVATYNVQDAQIQMFKEYLDGYIKECFVDVSFLYSGSIGNTDEMMEFLHACADNGCEGIMLFYTSDLQREVEFCADHGMYVIRASGNASDEEFEAVADNPYFLGEIGPGSETEYLEAVQMTHAMFVEDGAYVILSGGAFMGNEMHRQRTVAILDTLQQLAGVNLKQSSELLAMVNEPTVAETEGLKVIICPGYVELEVFGTPASEAIMTGEYDAVLSAIPVTPLMDALNSTDIRCGVIDCFSEDNFFGFQKGKIGYVAGKYQSEIGPAFAALLNAITGNAAAYRQDGRAFRLHQGFWTAATMEEYDSMYALARGAAVNAYNYEDLYAVLLSQNPQSTFADFRALVEAFSYEDCLARRAG